MEKSAGSKSSLTPSGAGKGKSFIRWEAILPTAIVVGLIFIYFFLFFDGHLRKGLEFIGYSSLGAEVNIGELKTSFTKASLDIRDIELTNSEKPTHNMVSIGEIKFGMNWDALLRGKILIEIASIEQIQFDSARKKIGRVKPIEPKDNQPSFLEKEGEKLANEALTKTKEQYGDNILGDIANLLSGGSAEGQLENLEGQLKSKEAIADLQKQVQAKGADWNQKIKGLPQEKDLQALGEKFKAIKTSNFKSPEELQQSIKQFETHLKEADGKIKGVEAVGQEISSDLKLMDEKFKELDSLVQSDVRNLEDHFKIPKLDAKSITNSLFQRYTGPYLAQFHKYQNMAHQYIPPGLLKKGSEEPKDQIEIQPRARDRGISYEFGRPNSYPFFWIKVAKISSKATPGVPALGNISGEALDITSNQILIGKPTQVHVNANFPELQIEGVEAQFTMNHTRHPFKESLNVQVASYPVERKLLIQGKDLEFGFNKATGSTSIKADFTGSVLDFSISNVYKQLDYVVSASNKEADSILKNIMSGIPIWTIDANGTGEFPNLPINLKSNLGSEIAGGFERILQERIKEAQAKVKKIIDENITKEKARLEAEFNKLKTQLDGEMKKIKEALTKQKSELETRMDQTKKEESKKLEKKVEAELQKRLGPDPKKKLEDLKKQIKF